MVLLLACAGLAVSQNLLTSEHLADLASMQNCYLIADSDAARARLVKELKKQAPQFQIVSSPDEAQFFLEYKVLKIESDCHPLTPTTYSEMTAYTMQDGQRIIAWSKKQDDERPSRKNEVNLVRNFIKALKKAKATRPHH
jgi:hypothetical protein